MRCRHTDCFKHSPLSPLGCFLGYTRTPANWCCPRPPATAVAPPAAASTLAAPNIPTCRAVNSGGASSCSSMVLNGQGRFAWVVELLYIAWLLPCGRALLGRQPWQPCARLSDSARSPCLPAPATRAHDVTWDWKVPVQLTALTHKQRAEGNCRAQVCSLVELH